MKGRRAVLPVCMAAICLLLAALPADAGLLYVIPAMEGALQDPDTGAKILGAIVEIQCVRETAPQAQSPGAVLESLLVPADADGVFRFPGKNYYLLFSRYDSLALTIRQPAHETLTLKWTWKELDAMRDGRNPEGMQRSRQTMVARWTFRDDTLRIKILPQALDAKYRDSPDLGQEDGLLAGEIYQTELYFRQAKKLGLSVDTREVFQLWKNMADRFPGLWPVMRDKEKMIEDILGGRGSDR